MLILVCNVGSTSLKFKLFNMPDATQLIEAKIERVGNPDFSLFSYANPSRGYAEKATRVMIPGYAEGISLFLSCLTDPDKGALGHIGELNAIGFKTVIAKDHTGVHELSDDVLTALDAYASIAPMHNPPYVRAIRQFRDLLPGKLLVGVFETGFHTEIPLARTLYAIPFEWYEHYGIQRRGMHGNSHGFIAEEVGRRINGPYRLISCHLGGSGSICAIRDGRSVDSSFGFSVQSGIPQANRCGDTDAYIIPYLLEQGLNMQEILHGLSVSGGLLGLSGVSNDLREIEQAELQGNKRAALAIDVYCESVLKYIGAFAAVLGGVDYLVFTGGIGENSYRIRNAICSRLGYLGVSIEPDTAPENTRDGVISKPSSPVTVAVIPTNEEVMIARKIFESWGHVGAEQFSISSACAG